MVNHIVQGTSLGAEKVLVFPVAGEFPRGVVVRKVRRARAPDGVECDCGGHGRPWRKDVKDLQQQEIYYVLADNTERVVAQNGMADSDGRRNKEAEFGKRRPPIGGCYT